MRSPKQQVDRSPAGAAARRDGRGFSLVELLAVLAVISIVVAFAVLGVKRAMASIRLQNSMRQLASRVELARTDAIRRHKLATVEFTSNSAYTITMDFNGTGVVGKRSYRLESGVTLTNSEKPMFEFDWRGRTSQCLTNVTLQSQEGSGTSTLAIGSAGDVTVDAGLGANMNSTSFSTVSKTGDVQKGAVVLGASPVCSSPCDGNCVSACVDCETESTPPPGCVKFTVKPSVITIRKNFKTSLDITATTTVADTITVIQNDGRTNLEFTPSPTQTFSAAGSKTFTVKSKNNLTGTFPLKFISACNPTNVAYATVVVNP
jgi:prepilin-type N-terminal cleavage/methylation domain-containing protein